MSKKQEIIHEAFDLFAQRGYQASMDELAIRVKLKTPSLYSHFPSKQDLFYQMIQEEIHHYFDWLKETIQRYKEENQQDRFEQLAQDILAYFEKKNRGRFWKNISLISEEELRQKCRSLMHQKESEVGPLIGELFQDLVTHGHLKQEQLQGAMYVYLAMIQGLRDLIMLYDDTSFDKEAVVRETLSFYQKQIVKP